MAIRTDAHSVSGQKLIYSRILRALYADAT